MALIDMTNTEEGFEAYHVPPKSAVNIQAQQINEDFFIIDDSGNITKGKAGDYILRDNGKNYIIPQDRFEQSFEEGEYE